MTDKIENLLKENNLIYYKRELNTGAIFIVPYRLVKFGVKLHIKIIIDNELKYYKMGFDCKKSNDEELTEKLLNLNSKLQDGVLSISTDSDEVSFRINMNICDELVWETYKNILYQCFAVFIKLFDGELIDCEAHKVQEKDTSDEE